MEEIVIFEGKPKQNNMIFFGTRSSNINNGQIINVDCPNCETNSTMIYSVFEKYAHVYWIPFFPIGRKTVTECNSCKRTFELKELSETIKNKIVREKEKSNFKSPIWMFSGLFVVVGIVLFSIYNSQETEKNIATYIKNPKVGDIYEIQMGLSNYSTMRLDKISKDSIYFTYNDYITDSSTGIDEIDIDKNYTTQKDVTTKKALAEMHKKETILSINR